MSDQRALGSSALKLVFGFSCSGLAFVATYSSAPTEFPATELKGIVLFGSAVHLLLLGAALVFLRSRAQNAALAIVVLASTASAYMIHTDLYLVGSRAGFWLASTAIGLSLFAVLEFMDSNRWLRGGVRQPRCWRW